MIYVPAFLSCYLAKDIPYSDNGIMIGAMAPLSSVHRRQLRPPTVNGRAVSAFLRFRSRHSEDRPKLGRRHDEARVLFKDGTVAWVTYTPSLQWWRERKEHSKLQEADHDEKTQGKGKDTGERRREGTECERKRPDNAREAIVEEEEERCSKALAMLAFSSGLPPPFDAIRTNVIDPCSFPLLRSRLEILLRILLHPPEAWSPSADKGWLDILPKLHPDKWLSCSGKELSKRAFLIAMREREKGREKKSLHGEGILHSASGEGQNTISRALEEEYMEAACQDECRVM